jgi:hypothetical protein
MGSCTWLTNFEQVRTVKCETIFEESETSENVSVIFSRTVAMRILGDSVTSRNHILPCHFVE